MDKLIKRIKELYNTFINSCKAGIKRPEHSRNFKWLVSRFGRMALRDKLILCSSAVAVAALIVVLCIGGGKGAAIDGADALAIADSSSETAETVPSEPTATPAPEPAPTRNPLLTQTTENNYVSALQNRLMELGYLDLDEPTDYYGSATAYAVQLFQRQHDLSMDGAAGEETLTRLFMDDAEKYVLRKGDSGLDVKNIQNKLKELGYYYGSIDGNYGEATMESVRNFQARNYLAVDGLAGEKTIDKMFSPQATPAAHLVNAEIRRANITAMVNTAYAQLGKPYILGAMGPNAFDCSGLVYYCLRQAGSSRGRYNAAGYASVTDWEKITSIYNLQIGDLLFFYDKGYTKIGHVGIYVGGGYMIDASNNNGRVVYRPCRTHYWVTHWAWGRRPW